MRTLVHGYLTHNISCVESNGRFGTGSSTGSEVEKN